MNEVIEIIYGEVTVLPSGQHLADNKKPATPSNQPPIPTPFQKAIDVANETRNMAKEGKPKDQKGEELYIHPPIGWKQGPGGKCIVVGGAQM